MHASSHNGIIIGELLYDEHTKKSYHIRVAGRDRPFYPQKFWREPNDRYMLNLTLYVRDQLDRGLVNLVD